MPSIPPAPPPPDRLTPPDKSFSRSPAHPLGRHFSWRELWDLVRPYWVGSDRLAGGLLLAAVVGLNLGQVYLAVLFNKWNNTFYTALQKLDYPAFTHQLLYFCVLATIYIVMAVYQLYLNQILQIRWREWLTRHYLDRWLKHRAFYRLQIDGKADNPDQRISDDLRDFVALTLSLSLGLLSSVVTLASFCAILWGLSGTLRFTLLGHAFAIPGYMVWAALVYAIVGSWLTDRIGRPLIALNFNQQRYEADFRYGLVRLRENAEAVALYGGEAREHTSFVHCFSFIVGNWWALIRRQKQLTWFTAGYSQAAVVFPFLVAAPRYFARSIELGGLMQTASAFGQVQGSLSYLVGAYADIANWRAVVDRLIGFKMTVEAYALPPAASIRLEAGAGKSLEAEGLALNLPDGKPLLAPAAFHIEPGESVLIQGPSGSGKSTLFRALSGIWPFGSGRVRLPAAASVMFLPQKPYMPLGTLAEALAYPEEVSESDDRAKEQALVDCGLAALVPRLDETENWSQLLSPGEQQRLAFARVLLKKPDWVFLDEATAALDEPMERALYDMIRRRLPHLTLVSVGHRAGLAASHERRLSVETGANGIGEIREAGAAFAPGE